MTDYGTLLRDHVTLRCRSIDRIFLQACVPRLQAVGGRMHVCSLAPQIPDSLVSRIWQNRGCVFKGDPHIFVRRRYVPHTPGNRINRLHHRIGPPLFCSPASAGLC